MTPERNLSEAVDALLVQRGGFERANTLDLCQFVGGCGGSIVQYAEQPIHAMAGWQSRDDGRVHISVQWRL